MTHGGPQAEGSNVDANWMLGIDDATDVIAADFETMADGTNQPVRGTSVIAMNTWYHAAVTYDGIELAPVPERPARDDAGRRATAV